MRDPNRIDSFCKKLAQYWKNVPDWRFGQLISNVYGASSIRDPFFAEEDETLELFEKFFDKPKDVLVILMGKSGSGKSSVGQELVDTQGFRSMRKLTDYSLMDSDQLAKGLANLKELKRICKENIFRFEDFDFDTLEYSRGEKLDYGYAQDYGGLETFLDKNNVSIEDFLMKKRYIVIVDGDEYNAWDKLKSSGIVNTSIIEKEVVMG